MYYGYAECVPLHARDRVSHQIWNLWLYWTGPYFKCTTILHTLRYLPSSLNERRSSQPPLLASSSTAHISSNKLLQTQYAPLGWPIGCMNLSGFYDVLAHIQLCDQIIIQGVGMDSVNLAIMKRCPSEIRLRIFQLVCNDRSWMGLLPVFGLYTSVCVELANLHLQRWSLLLIPVSQRTRRTSGSLPRRMWVQV